MNIFLCDLMLKMPNIILVYYLSTNHHEVGINIMENNSKNQKFSQKLNEIFKDNIKLRFLSQKVFE